MFSHVRRERFLVITLLAVENKRSGAVEVAGIESTRLANTPNEEKRCTTPQCHSSRGFLSVGKGTVRVFHVLISLSAISALERLRKFRVLTVAVEVVTKKSLTSSNELLTSVDASELLDLFNHGNDHTAQERPALRDNVVYWKTNRKIMNDLQPGSG